MFINRYLYNYIIFVALAMFLNINDSLLCSYNNSYNNPESIGQVNYIENPEEDLYLAFQRPVRITRTGVMHFFNNMYNKPSYSKYFALDFGHLSDFMNILYDNSGVSQPRTYIKSVLQIFSQKVKGSAFINAQAFSQFLQDIDITHKLIDYLKPDDKSIISSIEKYLNQLSEEVYNKALLHKSRSQDDEYTDEVKFNVKGHAKNIYKLARVDNLNDDDIYSSNDMKNLSCDISHVTVKQAIIKFIDLCLNKLIWSPDDQRAVWANTKEISSHLKDLRQSNLIDTSTLDELYWSLIHRFCYFLDIAGSEMNIQTIEHICLDIKNNNNMLWVLPEQERLMLPKKEYLRQALFNAYALSKARETGFLTPTKKG